MVRKSVATAYQNEGQLNVASTYPGAQRCLFIALGAFLSLASNPVLAQSPAAQRGLTFVRVHCAMPCHRQSQRESARNRAAVPNSSSEIPNRKPAPPLRGGNHDHPSDNAPVPA